MQKKNMPKMKITVLRQQTKLFDGSTIFIFDISIFLYSVSVSARVDPLLLLTVHVKPLGLPLSIGGVKAEYQAKERNNYCLW